MKKISEAVSLIDFEQAITKRAYSEAEDMLIKLATSYIESKVSLSVSPFGRVLTQEQANLESYQVIEKLATLVSILLSDWNFKPSKQFVQFISLQKNFLGNLFSATTYHSTDHILTNLGLVGRSNYSVEELQRLLWIVTIETDLELPWKELFKHLPNEAIGAYVGLLRSVNVQFSDRAKKNITALIAAADHAPVPQSNDVSSMSPIISIFFNCSNLDHDNKFAIKKWAVRAISRFNQMNLKSDLKKRLETEVKKSVNIDNPKIVVLHEHYFVKHAMYRCWHSLFEPIKDKYSTVAICQKDNIDTIASKDFTKVKTVASKIDVEKYIQLILDEKPDIIIFSSLGMSMWAPFVAELRLAPIQILCPGHPASSFMPNMDYLFTPDLGIPKEQMSRILSENWLSAPHGVSKMTLINCDIPQPNRSPEVANIIVNGVIQKVSHKLIDICKEITAKANRKVVFHFFMAHPKQNIEFFSAQSLLRRFLPNSVIHPFSSYENYLKVLACGDFAIPTLPFGGSNSNIDLVRLAIPKLYIADTSDLPGMTDVQVWETLGNTDGLCKNISELKNRAVELINNESVLLSLKEKLKQIDLHDTGILLSNDNRDERLLDAVCGILKANND